MSTRQPLLQQSWNISNPRPSSGLRRADEQASEVEHSSSAETARRKQTPSQFVVHRQTLKERFPDGWNPPRKLSREAMDGLRALHRHDPTTFSTPVLAERFKVSPEAVRRILRSKWEPSRDEQAKLLERERRRKKEAIMQRIEKERKERWERVDRVQKPELKDKLSLR